MTRVVCCLPAIAVTCFALACSGDQHTSTGQFRLDASGGLTPHIDGATEAGYADQFSSSGPGYSIALRFPAGQRVFGSDDPGMLVFSLDSLPAPGKYAVQYTSSGARHRYTVDTFVSSKTMEHLWKPIDGTVDFAHAVGTRDGLRAEFHIRFVREQGGAPDTALLIGSLTTR